MWRDFFQKKHVPDILVFSVFSLMLIVFNWRFFLFGSLDQRFLYGDNLVLLNNFYFLFNHFSFFHPFETLLGSYGMSGGYVMAEPQGSIFYIPVTFILILYKIFHWGMEGIYSSLLFLYALHSIVGAFFVYKIAARFFALDRFLAFFAGSVYLGLGWNAAWFGTPTLSYMIGLIPFVFWEFFLLIEHWSFRRISLLILSIILFLYAGGIVNFLFYIFLNFFLIFLAIRFFPFGTFSLDGSWRQYAVRFLTVFVFVPIVSLLGYSAQLWTTFSFSKDIFHSQSSYDYLAFFGMHFYDLIGIAIPHFGLSGFLLKTNPRMMFDFSLTHILYVGILPLAFFVAGLLFSRRREFGFLALLCLVNFLFSFGGAFFLYNISYMIPGNNLFRGHYKYLIISGLFLSLSCAVFLKTYMEDREFRMASVTRYFSRYFGVFIVLFALVGLLGSCIAFGVKVIERSSVPFQQAYFSLATDIATQGFRMALLALLSFAALRFFLCVHHSLAKIALIAVLILDVSVNYAYGPMSEMRLPELLDTSFFKSLEGKTVVNDIDAYSQIYFLPEFFKTNVLLYYSAIPNKYLTEYYGHIRSSGKFHPEVLKAAGVDGVLSDKTIDDPGLNLEKSSLVTADNYHSLYLYNASGDLFNDWGYRPEAIGNRLNYYSLGDARKAFFTSYYLDKSDPEKIWRYIDSNEFSADVPIILSDKNMRKADTVDIGSSTREVSWLTNTPTEKSLHANNGSDSGLIYVPIPYSSLWKAEVNGHGTEVFRANNAFIGVKVDSPNASVRIFMDTARNTFFLWVSILTIFGLMCIVFFERFFTDFAAKVLSYGRFRFQRNIKR